MGFRSTFITEDHAVDWPQWFRDRYAASIGFPEGGPLASLKEAKTEGTWGPLAEDIQRAIDWDTFIQGVFVMVYLHECGGITRCQIERNAIGWSEPKSWRTTTGVEHLYCYGCSDHGGMK